MNNDRLKKAAKAIDIRLKGKPDSDKHMTMIHGDPKYENFKFN